MQPFIHSHNQTIPPSFINFSPLQHHLLQENTITETCKPSTCTYVSEKDYWENYYEMNDICYEWCNGKLEEKPMADLASFNMYNWFLMLLNEYFREFPEGIIVGLEIGFKMSLPNQISIRKPDLAFIHKSNPVQMQLDERSYKGCFDMCIEFLSDSTPFEIFRDTVIKKAEYEQAGIQEYYILDRKHAETVFYRLNAHGQYIKIEPENNGIIKSNVLSDFQFCYDDLFDLPSSEKLREDPVYARYFQTDYLKIKQRAEKAERSLDKVNLLVNKEKIRADEEKRRADKEKCRADKEKCRADEAIAREKELIHQLEMLKKH